MTGSSGALSRLYAGTARLVARFPFGVSALDRIGLSLFSFALSLALARLLTPDDFGTVSLWMALALFAVDLQNALVGTPLNVHVAGSRDAVAAQHLKTAVTGANGLLVIILTVAAAVVLAALGLEPDTTALTIAIPFYLATLLLREFNRSLAFSQRDLSLLLWVDLPYIAITAACLAAMLLWPRYLVGVVAVFLMLSVGSAAALLLLLLRRSTEKIQLRGNALRPYATILADVSWATVGVIAGHVKSRSYVYIAASLAGMAATAALALLVLLFRPVNLLVGSWSSAALPRLAGSLGSGDGAGFRRMLGRTMALGTAGNLVWFLVLLLAWDPIATHLLAGKYPEIGAMLLPAAVSSGFWVLHSVCSTGLVAAREFRFLAQVDILCGAAAAGSTAALILWQGYPAAMWGVAAGYGIAFVLEGARLRAVLRRLGSSAAPPCRTSPVPSPAVPLKAR